MACIDENFLPRIFFSRIFLTMNFSQTTVISKISLDCVHFEIKTYSASGIYYQWKSPFKVSGSATEMRGALAPSPLSAAYVKIHHVKRCDHK